MLTLVSTFFFLPKHFVQTAGTDSQTHSDGGDRESTPEKLQDDHDDSGSSQPSDVSKGDDHVVYGSLRSIITSPVYLLSVMWMVFLQLRFLFMMISLNKTIELVVDNDEDLGMFHQD